MNQGNMENGEFDNQGVENSYGNVNSTPSVGFPRVSSLNNARNNPVFGIGRGNNSDDVNNANADHNKNSNDMPGMRKGDVDKNKTSNDMPGAKKNDDSKNNNGMPGMKKSDDNKGNNGMPGMKKDSKDNNKNKDNKKSLNDKSPKGNKEGNKGNIKKPGERKNLNPLARLNPLNRLGLRKSSTVSSSSSGDDGKSRNKFVSLFMKLPLVVKVKVVAGASVVLLLFIVFFLVMSILGATTAVIAASCTENSYDIGSADATAFLKNMDDPLGDIEYSVTSLYGWRNCPKHGYEFHHAVDLGASSGTKVYAVSGGTISEIGYNGEFGNTITINHNDTFYTMYNHLSGFKSGLEKGDTVKQGDVIGYVGNTGSSTGPHLDFRLFDKDKKSISINAYFGYSDKGYEECVNPDKGADVSKCDLDSTGNARKLGSSGFSEIASKTNDYTDDSCCSSYSSSVSVDGTSGLPKNITEEFVNGAIQAQSKYGVPASLTLAQLLLESGTGSLSELATDCHNLFGVKGVGPAGYCLYSTGENYNGVDVTVNAKFRKYNTYAESFEDRAEILSGSWYKRCTKTAKTADDWAKAIRKCGYATDPNYPEKLISIMKEYNLYQYDDSSVFGTGSSSCDTGTTGDIVDKANEEYEKWNKSSEGERSDMVRNYMEACGNGRTCNHWCSGFVSYILKETGRLDNLKGFNCLADSYTSVEPATHHKQGSGYTPKAGDIIVFEYNGDGKGDHVAIVESVKGKTIHYIGGNQTSSLSSSCWGNAITKVTTSLDSKSILEFVTIG